MILCQILCIAGIICKGNNKLCTFQSFIACTSLFDGQGVLGLLNSRNRNRGFGWGSTIYTAFYNCCSVCIIIAVAYKIVLISLDVDGVGQFIFSAEFFMTIFIINTRCPGKLNNTTNSIEGYFF